MEDELNYWAKNWAKNWEGVSRRRLSRRQALRGAALATGGLTAAAIIGCGDEEGDGTSSTATETGTTADSATAAPTEGGQPRFGGSLTTSLLSDPPGWSVLRAAGVTGGVNSMAQDKLLEFRAGPGADPTSTELMPGLAEALPEQPDDLTYVFKIRQGVKFQNVDPVNGREMTVEDVKYAIDTISSEGSDFESYFEAVESVEAVDDTTLRVTTFEPYAPLLLSITGQYGWFIFPRELVETNLTDSTTMGTGAYIHEEWQQGNRIVYRKNPDYWNNDGVAPGPPGYLDEITYLIVPAPDSNIAALSTGQIDLLHVDVPSELRDRIPGEMQVQEFTGSNLFSGIDTSQPPFDDVRTRQAIWKLYDREGEKQAIYGGSSFPTTLLTQAEALSAEGVHGDMLIRDVDEAKKLLGAAGYPDGFETDVAWTDQYGKYHADTVEFFISSVSEAGIKLNPVFYEYGLWISEIYRPPFNWVGMCWGAGRIYPEPDQEVRYWLYPDGNTNQSRVNDPVLNEMIDRQVVELNPDTRWEILHDIQRYEAENSYYLFKNREPSTNYYTNRVHDWQGDPRYSWHRYWHVWVDEA